MTRGSMSEFHATFWLGRESGLGTQPLRTPNWPSRTSRERDEDVT
jgi:hypothetical protein